MVGGCPCRDRRFLLDHYGCSGGGISGGGELIRTEIIYFVLLNSVFDFIIFGGKKRKERRGGGERRFQGWNFFRGSFLDVATTFYFFLREIFPTKLFLVYRSRTRSSLVGRCLCR